MPSKLEFPRTKNGEKNQNLASASKAFELAIEKEDAYSEELRGKYSEPNQLQFLHTLYILMDNAEQDALHQIIYEKKPLTPVQRQIVVRPDIENTNEIINQCYVLSAHFAKYLAVQDRKPFYIQFWNYPNNLNIDLALTEARSIAMQIKEGIPLEDYLHKYLNISNGSVAFRIPKDVGIDMAKIHAQIAKTKKQLE